MTAPIPTIETARLILRGPVEADFPTVERFMASPRAAFIGGPVTDRFQAWRGFLAVLGHWALRGYGFFTVTLKDGTLVGRVGLINHIGWHEPELGWHLFDGFEGHGYAAEAAIAARDWAASELGLGPLISHIDADNTRSLALARRLGATHERDTTVLGLPAQVWRHPAPASEQDGGMEAYA